MFCNTIKDTQMLMEKLAAVKVRGYSLDNMEHEMGVR
ncbi:IclR family transcriptional regulator domain-containing protein [Anaerocolumna jejuensis]